VPDSYSTGVLLLSRGIGNRVKESTVFSRVLKYSAVSLGVLILLTFLFLVFVTLPPGERFLKGIVEGRLSGFLEQPVEIGRMETNLVSRFEFKDIRIPPVEPDTGGVHIASLRLNYSLWPLLSKTLRIKSIEIDSPRIEVVYDSTQGFNLALLDLLVSSGPVTSLEAEPSQDESGEGGWGVELGPVRIDGMYAGYVDRGVPMNAFLSELSLTADQSDTLGLSFRLASGSGSIEYARYPEMPLGLIAEGAWRDSLIIADTTYIVLGDLDLKAHGIVGVQGSKKPVDLMLRLQGDPAVVLAGLREQFGLGEFTTEGPVSISVDLSGTLPLPEGTLRAELPRVRAMGLSMDEALLVAGHRGDSVVVDTLYAEILDGAIAAGGGLRIDSFPDGMFDVSIRSIDIAGLWEALHDTVSAYEGSITGEIEVVMAGDNWRDWTVDADIEGENARYRSLSLEGLAMSVGLNERRLSADIRQDYFRVEGDIALGENSIDGTVSADIERLEPLAMLANVRNVQGAVSLQADLGGSFSDPIVRGRVLARDLVVAGTSIDTLTGNLRLAGKEIAADSLLIRQDDLMMQARASFDRSAGAGEIVAVFYDTGRDRIENTTTPTGIDTIDFLRRPVSFAGIGYFDADFSFSGGGVFMIDATGRDFELNLINMFEEDMADVGGEADFDITAQGPLNSLMANVKLSIDRPNYTDVSLDSLRLDGSFESGTVSIREFNAYYLNQSLRSELFAELSRDDGDFWTVMPEMPTRGSVEMSEFDLGMLAPLLPEESDIDGLASLDLEWDGTLTAPGIAGSIDVDSAYYVWSEADSTGVVNVNIAGTIADSTLTLESAKAEINDVPVSLEGTLTLLPGNRVRIDLPIEIRDVRTVVARGILSPEKIDITADIDSLGLAMVQPFVPGIERMRGHLSASAKITGAVDDLDVSGNARASDMEIKPVFLSDPLTDAYMSAEFTRNSVRLDTLFARMKKGTISSSGEVAIDTAGISEINFALAADNLDFDVRDYLEIRVESADLSWGLVEDYYQLAGRIDLGRVEYSQDFQPSAILPFTQQVEQVETPLPTVLARSRLNLKIVNSDSIWIDNNLAHLRANADLQFIGFLASPNISGRLVIEEGYVLYLDRKFTVTDGVAYFTDPNQINPEVNLRAVADVSTYQQTQRTEYQIILAVTGRIQNPTVELSSQPPLPRPDIISILTLGATRGELAGETSQVLQERAEMIASQQISQFATRELGGAMGLDSVTVTGNIFDIGGEGAGPELILAQKVSDEVTVTYRTNVGHLNEQRVSVDWQIDDHWLVEGTTTRNGESALSITYALRFR
jgi:autotransporter translocation and assembly factor TamB